MAYVSTVHVDPPTSSGVFLASWSQPFTAEQDALPWRVTTNGVTRQVQRDRLTDRVYFCQVLVAGGTTSFDVETGADLAPATAWVAPDLTGLAIRHFGQDGSRQTAALDGSDGATVTDLLRDGHASRTLRRWVHSKIDVVGAGNQSIGDEVLGHHAYLRYRADWPGVVELDLVISNASTTVATQGNGITGLFGHVYLTGSSLVLPAGWAVIAERALPSSSDPVFPTKLATVRRYVLYATGDAANAARAQDVAELRGLGFAREGSSYLHVPSFLALETIVPDLASGYSYNGVGGYQGAEQRAAARYASIRAAVDSGTGGPEYLNANRLGYFHPLGEIDPQAPGGSDIDTHAGVELVRSNVRFERLRGDLKIDGSGLWCLDRATGRPLRTSDFGSAYTVAGSIPSYDPNPAYLGRQPFSFFVQNNAGYEIGTKDTASFLGWWPPAWPPHALDVRGNLPNGQTNPSFDKYAPVFPSSGWGPAPHTLQVGTSAAEFDLISSWQPHPVFGAAGYYIGRLCYRDPEDSQHAVRMTLRAEFLAFAAGDLVSIDFLDQVAEWLALQWSEVGHVRYLYYEGINGRSLLDKWAQTVADPGRGRGFIQRDGAWTGRAFAAQFALASVARRESGYPTKGIKRRAELMFELIRDSAMPDGTTYRLPYAAAASAGQLAEAWQPPTGGLSGAPIPQRYSISSVGLELPLCMSTLFALGRQLGRVSEAKPHILNAIRSHTADVGAYVASQYNPNEWGPQKYAAVWDDLTNQPWTGPGRPRAFDGTGNPGHPNHEVLLELGYRLTGQTGFLDISHSLGFRSAPGTTRAQRGANLLGGSAWPFSAGLIAYLLGQAGPDDSGPSAPITTDLSGVLGVGVTLSGVLELEPAIDPPPVDPPPSGGGSGGGTGGEVVSLPVEAPGDYTEDGLDPLGPNALLTWSNAGGTVRVVGPDLARESGLASAVLISVFADRRAEPDPLQPLEAQDLRGWWGETAGDPFGSRLWRLSRAPANRETLARAREAVTESLEWMKAEGIARQIDVEATYIGRGVLAFSVVIFRGTSRRWAHLWKGATSFELRAGNVTLHVEGRTGTL